MAQIIDYDTTASGEEVRKQNNMYKLFAVFCRQEHTLKEERYCVVGY